MAGRGRGKGKGRGGNLAMSDLMRSNAEDLGVDERGMGQEPPPPLWPEIEGGMPALLPMTEEDRAVIERQRRQVKRMQESPYFLEDAKVGPDVLRWGDRDRTSNKGQEVLGRLLATSTPFVPPELVAATKRRAVGSVGKKRRGRASSLSEKELRALEEIEGKAPMGGEGGAGGRGEGGEGDGGEGYEEGQDDEEEGFDQDYLENHFESDKDDGDDDGDGGEGYL